MVGVLHRRIRGMVRLDVVAVSHAEGSHCEERVDFRLCFLWSKSWAVPLRVAVPRSRHDHVAVATFLPATNAARQRANMMTGITGELVTFQHT